MAILVTGGAGFIGSHTIVALHNAGFETVIIDDFSNSEPSSLDGIEAIIGLKPTFYKANLLEEKVLDQIFTKHTIEGVIHFAASKAVGESVADPLKYYINNVAGTAALLKAMQKAGVKNIVFSSSCTVYGQPEALPVTETSPIQVATSPYGNTKQIGEEMLHDVVKSALPINAISLRYFNPIGAHESTLIGELPKGEPANLVPYITQTVAGKRTQLQVFGNDYPTADGTAIRDYIHVVDLAEAHLAAVKLLFAQIGTGFYDTFNIGTGQGSSVLEVINAFEDITGQKINYTIKPRRTGDVVAVYASVSKASEILQWKTRYSLKEALASAWAWEQKLI
jgi:UDP-glucose 4-epimerase